MPGSGKILLHKSKFYVCATGSGWLAEKGPLPAVSRHRVPVTTAQGPCGVSPRSQGHLENAARASPQESHFRSGFTVGETPPLQRS